MHLYLHIAFCRVKCPYCSFNVYTGRRAALRATPEALLREFDLRAGPDRPHLDTIYFGGGTPSLLPPGDVARVLDGLAARAELAKDVEITLESEPGTVSAATYGGYRSAGVNRLTIGVQSFSSAALRFLGRPHGPDDARAAIGAAREVGFENLDIDMIFGHRGQTLPKWEADINEALSFSPEHLSLYDLTVEPGTRLAGDVRSGRVRLPAEDRRAALWALARDLCRAAGYRHYEVSNFARPGFHSRHNSGVWDGERYLGLGPGAVSFDPTDGPWGRRSWNLRAPERWLAALAVGETAEEGDERLDATAARLEMLMLGLRRDEGVSRPAFLARFGIDPAVAVPSHPAHRGYFVVTPDRVALTDAGRIIADSATLLLDRSLDSA